jgi:hypothetical protein
MTNKEKETSTSQKANKNDKEWLRSILVTGFFIVVFVCAFFWMDVEKNTQMQFVDKMLSWDIVETAAQKAKTVKEAITPLQKLAWWIDDISIDSFDVKDLSKLKEKLSALEDLKASYDKLKNDEDIKWLVPDADSENTEDLTNLVTSEKWFVDNAISFFNFLLNNQDALSFNDEGTLEVDESVKSTFDDLLLDFVTSQDKVKQANSLYEEWLE